MKRPYCVALTGGIGSGKSAVADGFAGLGVAVVDTDGLARELTRPGGDAMPEIIEAFGPESVAPDGGLDRAWMRARVFGEDTAARRRLEAILHPRIRLEAARRVARAESAYVILVVPLLVEYGGYDDIADRVLVVDCDESTQVARVIRRDGYSEARVRSMIAAQTSRQARLRTADDILLNEGGMNDLPGKVAALHQRYLAFAHERARRR